jgi:hypothetical protein
MRSTVPILICDHEDGCDRWEIDYHGMGVDNWRDLLGGWAYDPYVDDTAYCPDHKGESQ